TATPPTHIYTLSLHDALPISIRSSARWASRKEGLKSSGFTQSRPIDTDTVMPSSDSATASRMRVASSSASGSLPSGDCGTSTMRSEEHTSELQSPYDLVCRLL